MATDMKHVLEVLGIKLSESRERSWLIYKIYRHARATLDHSKHPEGRSEPWPDSPWFAESKEANEWAYRKSQEDPEYLYEIRLVPIKESLIPEDLLKQVRKRKY